MTKKRQVAIRDSEAPRADNFPAPQPGTRMLVIPTCAADPMQLAEESIEKLKREHPPRVVKTSKRKQRKAAR